MYIEAPRAADFGTQNIALGSNIQRLKSCQTLLANQSALSMARFKAWQELKHLLQFFC